MNALYRRSLLAALAACTLLVYWPGLHGSFVLDDEWNLSPLLVWKQGGASAMTTIFGNRSGPLGRPVAMASFLLNEAATGHDPFYFKLTNLLLHVACGLLLYLLARRLFAKAGKSSWQPAVLAAAWWMFSPLLASTVLYSVQRMTQLSMLFSLLSMIAFWDAMELAGAGKGRKALLPAAAALLLFVPLSVLSKENGILTLAFLFLLHAMFSDRGVLRMRPQWLAAGLGATLLAMFLASLCNPFEAGYALRGYSSFERLLTESRIVVHYLQQLLAPSVNTLGLYHDDITLSTGLLSPLSTLASIITLALLLALAGILGRHEKWKVAGFGILFFITGHLLESGIVPLELYFEHRNYVPAAGVALALANLAANMADSSARRARLLYPLIALYLLALAAATHYQARIWGNDQDFLVTSAIENPKSPRAQSDAAEYLFNHRHPDKAFQLLAQAARETPSYALVANLQMITFTCRLRIQPPPALIAAAADSAGTFDKYYLALSIGLNFILDDAGSLPCATADYRPLARALLALDQTRFSVPPRLRPLLWQQRVAIARMADKTGDTAAALGILRSMWHDGTRNPLNGLLLLEILVKQQQYAEARAVLTELKASAADSPPEFIRQLQDIDREISQGHTS